MHTARKKNRPPLSEDGWLSIPRAAEIVGCSPATIGTYVMKGKLRTQSVAGRVFVEEASAHALAAELEQDRSSKSSTKP